MTADVRQIQDYIVLALPSHIDASDPDQRAALFDELTDRATQTVMAQYQRPPKALLLEPIDWLITSDPADVERHQPAHDCETCRAGNVDAQAFLLEHPGRLLALGNLTYTEVWT